MSKTLLSRGSKLSELPCSIIIMSLFTRNVKFYEGRDLVLLITVFSILRRVLGK